MVYVCPRDLVDTCPVSGNSKAIASGLMLKRVTRVISVQSWVFGGSTFTALTQVCNFHCKHTPIESVCVCVCMYVFPFSLRVQCVQSQSRSCKKQQTNQAESQWHGVLIAAWPPLPPSPPPNEGLFLVFTSFAHPVTHKGAVLHSLCNRE